MPQPRVPLVEPSRFRLVPPFVVGIAVGACMILLQQSLSSRLAGTTAGDWQNDHPQPTHRRYPSFSSSKNGENLAGQDGGGDEAHGSPSASDAANDGVSTGESSSAYNTSSGIVAGKVNVHLVPHSHDDLGWLNTVEQYYITAVQFILETVVDQLEANPDRRFIQVEQVTWQNAAVAASPLHLAECLLGFFYRWWQQQSEGMRQRVRALVHSGQLEFINGGWVMHDEAVCHYRDVLHHMSLGHRFLQSHFNATPRIAWQIDPFGHSATQASLITAQGGLDAVFFARADHEDIARRKRERSTEFVWRASQTFGRQAEVFAGILYWDGYFAPQPFRFEPYDPLTNLVKDDPYKADANIVQLVEAFVNKSLTQAGDTRSEHVMWAMGEDFSHANAALWFKNLDKLIHYVNLDGRVNALYSTPSRYLHAKHRSNQSWPLKQGDFFPYASASTEYWTGYYSSRPAFKGYARMCSSLLQAATLLEASVGKSNLQAWGNSTSRLVVPVLLSTNLSAIHAPTPTPSRLASTYPLEEAVAVAQHHDAITGTAKQHVNDDYTLQLYKGAQEVGMGACGVMAVAQHHGAITGSARQHVNDDYTLQLQTGLQTCLDGLQTCLDGLQTCLDGLQTCLDGLQTCLDGLQTCLDGLQTCLDGLQTCLDGLQTCLDGLQTCLDGLPSSEFSHSTPLIPPSPPPPPLSSLPPSPVVLCSFLNPMHVPSPTPGVLTSSLTHLISQGALDLKAPVAAIPAAPAARTTGQPAAPVPLGGSETLYNETGKTGSAGRDDVLRLGLDFQLCPLLNISYCPPTHSPIPPGTTLVIAAYNPLGWARDEIMRIPVSVAIHAHSSPSFPALPSPPFPPSASRFCVLPVKPALCHLPPLHYSLHAAPRLLPVPQPQVSSPAVIVTDAHGNVVPSQAIPEVLVPWETRERYMSVQVGEERVRGDAEGVRGGKEGVKGGKGEKRGREVRETQRQQGEDQQQGEEQQQKKQQQQEGVVVSVVFRAKVPPLGYSTFFLSPAPPHTPGAAVTSTEWQARVQPGTGGGEWGKGEEAGEGEEEGRGEGGKEGKEVGEEEGVERESVVVEEEGEGVGGGDVIVLGGWVAAAAAGAAGAGGAGGAAAAGGAGGAAAAGGAGGAGGAGAATDGKGSTNSGSTAPGSSPAPSVLRVLFSKTAYGMTRLQLLGRSQQGNETVAAGAYIFNPPHAATSAQNMSQQASAVPIRVLRGPLVEEFHRALAPWLSEVIRVYPGRDYAEMHYMVGPVPRKPSVAREVVTRFASSIASAGALFTDSQARDYLRRVRDHRADWNLTVYQPIAGNFYPLTAGVFIAGSTAQLSLLVDRPLGVASLADGQIEVMLHRRMISDDGKGVQEVLDERVCDSHGNCTPLAVVGFVRFALHPSTPSDTDCYGGDAGHAGDSNLGAAAGASSNDALNSEHRVDTGSEEWVSEDSDPVRDSANVGNSDEIANAVSDEALNSEDREQASGKPSAESGAADSQESQPPSGRRKLGGKGVKYERLGGKGKQGREGKERGEATVGGVGEGGGLGSVRGEAARWRKEHAERMLSPLQLAFALE
ncbi:unnamed protein product, partial [Closterium sp. NIES-64]